MPSIGPTTAPGICLVRDGGAVQFRHQIKTPPIFDEYARGRRDGLRLPLSILEAEEAKWEALLGEGPSWRTNAIRVIRHKACQVARKRVQTALHRFLPNEIAHRIEQAGL